MKILQVHNFYSGPGGEDQVYAAEHGLLTGHGHTVARYTAHNSAITQISGFSAAVKTVWNSQSYREAREVLKHEAPDVIHVHNSFPLISPALYYAAAAESVPVVQTLHNYRLICPGANLYRQGHVCQDCVGSLVPYRAVMHRCYRDSVAASAVTASMLSLHRLAGTWKNKVQAYITLTNFARNKFIEGGLPAGRIVVKPNFLAKDPGVGRGEGDYALFVGRLCEEKGVRALVTAWEGLDCPLRLKIAGDGPLGGWVKERSAAAPAIEWLGHTSHEAVMQILKDAKILVCPSLYHEGGPLTIIEALGCGTPVIASELESINEFINEGVNGFRFRPGDPADLRAVVHKALAQPERLNSMRPAARQSYERNYTPERNYRLLMRIYEDAIQSRVQTQYCNGIAY